MASLRTLCWTLLLLVGLVGLSRGQILKVEDLTASNGFSAVVTTRRLQDQTIAYEYYVLAEYVLKKDYKIDQVPQVRDVARLTEIFYRRIMGAAFPLTYRDVDVEFFDGVYFPDAKPPFIDVIFNTTFVFGVDEGSDREIPTSQEVFEVASTFDEEDYLEKFVKLADPAELFQFVVDVNYLVFTLPSESPSMMPTEAPILVPTVSAAPTTETMAPSATPSRNPTVSPSASPTRDKPTKPTDPPTEMPSEHPTKEPSAEPTKEPTASPSFEPTGSPTEYVAFVELTLENDEDADYVFLTPETLDLAQNQLVAQYELDLPGQLATFVPGTVSSELVALGGASKNRYAFQFLISATLEFPFPKYKDYIEALEAADYQLYGNRLIQQAPGTYGSIVAIFVDIGDADDFRVTVSVVADLTNGETVVTEIEQGVGFSSLQELGNGKGKKKKKGHD